MNPTLGTRAASALTGIDRPIAVLAALSFISASGVSIMLPLLPLYAIQVGATPAQLGLMVAVFSVTNTIGQLSSGVLVTWLPARRQMPLGQAIYATGNFLIATATAAVPVIAFRAFAGLGGGLTIIAERLYIARVAAQERLAFMNGIVSAAGSTGSVVGPLVGAVLATGNLSLPFIAVGITATVAGLAALAFLPPERRTGLPDSADGPRPPAEPGSSGPTAGTAPAAIQAGAQLQPRTSRWADASPLVRLALWSLGFNAAYGAWITTFAPYSTTELGMTPSQVVLYFGAFGVGAILLGPILARTADRIGRRRMVAIGTAMILAGTVVLILGAPLPLIYVSAAVAGGGVSGAQSSWFALLGVATDGGRRGRSFGLTSALSNLGVIAGAVAASMAWSVFGVQAGVATAAVFSVLAAAGLLAVPSDRPRA